MSRLSVSPQEVLARCLVTVGIIFYAVAVPFLEWNSSHVFNPEWPSHARLHEVWQLATNCGIGLFSLWLVWFKDRLRLAGLMTLLVTGGFFIAYYFRSVYGGSMLISDGTEKLVLGINIGVFGFGVALTLMVFGLLLSKSKKF